MSNLRNIFLFKIIILIILNLYFRNWFLLIISILLCFLESFEDGLVFIILLLLISLISLFRFDFIPFGVVEKQYNNSILVEKGLYRIKVNTNKAFAIGDVVFAFGNENIQEAKDLENNILFAGNDDAKLLLCNPLRKLAQERLNAFSNKAQNLLGKILFNLNSTEVSFLSGFYFYYLLMILKRKNRAIANIVLLIYLLVFGFEIKLLVYIIDSLLVKLNRSERFLWQIYLLALINKNLLLNKSLLVALVFNFMNLMGYKRGNVLMATVESWLFGSFNFLYLFLFNFYRNLKAIIFLLSFAVFLIPIGEAPYLVLMDKLMLILDFNLAIRGRINIIKIGIMLLIIYKLKIVNEKGKLLVFVLMLFLPNIIFPCVSFIDVGQGDAILISDGFGIHNVLIDTGSPYNWSKLNAYLKNRGIYKIDYLIITHADNDHAGNVESLKKEYLIGDIVNKGQNISFGKYLLANFNRDTYDDPNDNSLVYYLIINNTSFLFTGDISKKVEERLIGYYPDLHCDILKCSHHGSKTGSSKYFVRSLAPDYAIYSTSGLYDHPHSETVRTMNALGVSQLSTKECGSISFSFIGDYLLTNYKRHWVLNKT